MAVDCLVALVGLLAEREAQPADLGAGPVAQTWNLKQEVDLLLLGFHFKLLEEFLVEFSPEDSKVALV